MASYPNEIATPRTMVNRPSVIYDEAKTKIIYAEDFNKDRAEIVAIETELGTNIKGGFADLKARIEDIERRLALLE